MILHKWLVVFRKLKQITNNLDQKGNNNYKSIK